MNKKTKNNKPAGNIFEQLALPHPQRLLARAKVMLCISEIIRKRALTQKDAALLLGVPQSKISCLMNGKLNLFSLDTLFEFLRALDRSVEIVIKPNDGTSKNTHISLAA